MKTNSNFVIYNKKKNVKEISQKFGITPLTSVILCNRDIYKDDEIRKILSENLSDLNEAKLLPDVDKACEILKKYIEEKKSIRIVGDYDVDGVCSTYILYDSISGLGGNVSYYIPDRFRDGYGINLRIIDEAIKDNVKLIITCDNGIAANDQISYAKKNGIEVIVTDHHDIGILPRDASAIVDPKRKDVETMYPFDGICGAVVAMKFVVRYYELYKSNVKDVLDTYIDFAMIATVSDIMPLVNENHIIVKYGLKSILNTKNAGLKKLIELSGIDLSVKSLTTYHIGFIIGPLINAAGRMDSACIALKLFLSDDEEEIDNLAKSLKELNDERKMMTDSGTKLALNLAKEKFLDDKVLVIYIEGLHEQVAGIVAGRVKDSYNKPVIVLTDTTEEKILKASCRSIEAYDIFEALNRHRDMLLKFGGHKLAAGFSMEEDKVDMLRKLLNAECNLSQSDFEKKVYIDAELPFYMINEEIIKDIEKIEPYGQSFSRPLFATRDVKVKVMNIYGNDKNVVRLSFTKDNNVRYGVIFEEASIIEDRLCGNDSIDIVYYPKINDYKGIKSIEINLQNYR